MKVWIVNPFDNLPLEGYRPQRYWLMSQAFAAAGHDVVYWTSDFSHANKAPRIVDDPSKWPDGYPSVSNGVVEVRLVPTPPYAKNVSLARVRSHRALARNWLACAAAEEAKPDLVVASLPPLRLPFLAKAFADSVGAAFVVDVMDDWPGTFYRLLPRCLRWLGPMAFAGSRRLARHLYAHADLVTGCSDRYETLARAAGAGAFHRAYHGIELPSPPVRTARAAAPSDAISLVYVGGLGRTYDLETLLRAVERLPDSTLDVAGAGEQERLFVACRSPQVRFHGYCDEKRLAELLAAADIGIVPMRGDSCVGVPYKLADYAAAGLGVVSCLGGESGTLLARYGAGAEYRWGDVDSLAVAIRSLAERLPAVRSASRKLAESEFDAKRIYAGYVAVCERAVTRKLATAGCAEACK